MLTKRKPTKTKASKTVKGKRPPVVFTAAQKRRMRALFALRNERLLTTAEQEGLHRLVDAFYDDMIEKATRKVLVAHPEYADEHGNLNIPLVDKLLREKYATETHSNEKPKKERKRV